MSEMAAELSRRNRRPVRMFHHHAESNSIQTIRKRPVSQTGAADWV